MITDGSEHPPWNYLKITDRSIEALAALNAHQGLHRVGPESMNFLERALYGTPSWAKAAGVSGAGHVYDLFSGN